MATSRSRSPTFGLIGILKSMRKWTNEDNVHNLDTSEAEVFQETPVIQDKPSHNSQTEISQTKKSPRV